MHLQESGEMYLESILVLIRQGKAVRSIDIVDYMGYSKPSVSIAMKQLRENGYITMDKDGLITLTASGMAIAERMLDRHHTLTKFLMALGIDAATAETAACKIEHDISQTTYDAICAPAKAHM